MSVIIQVTQDDLLETRFAYNPLVELTISYCTLHNPALYSRYQRWVDEAKRALHDVELPFMSALIVPGCRYIPDFLTPTPTIIQLDIEHEIEQLLTAPDEVIHASIRRLIDYEGESELRQYFLTHTHEALHCLAQELRIYWQRALEPHWNRLTAILDGDVLYHARRMALEGPEKMLAEMHPRLRYANNAIEIETPGKPDCLLLHGHSLQGDGLQLVPSIFAGRGIHWQVVPEWHPMIIYVARGVGLWRQDMPERNPSLEIALGEGRARVLQQLTTPANTGEIARKLHITAGAASQHLSRLNEAGLVEPHRNGRRVYYHLTDRGAQLLLLFDRAG